MTLKLTFWAKSMQQTLNCTHEDPWSERLIAPHTFGSGKHWRKCAAVKLNGLARQAFLSGDAAAGR
jgi:hypothetical protein